MRATEQELTGLEDWSKGTLLHTPDRTTMHLPTRLRLQRRLSSTLLT